MPFTQEELALILKAISEDKPFRSEFGKIAEDIIDKIYSYYTNPNCSCKGAILEWVNKNEDKTRQLINTFKDTFDKLKNTTQTTTQSTTQSTNPNIANPVITPNNVKPANVKIGETMTIEPTTDAYRKLFNTINQERWVFRGIQVIPGEDDGKDVWFILFY
jgi:hypothetical protein